jgi:FkbM family methyltransferase
MSTNRTSRRIARDVFLRKLGLERSYRPPVLFRHPDWNFDSLLKPVVGDYLRARPDFTFFQVGAFDGFVKDPVYPLVRAFGLRGLVVEPQVSVLDTLKANYADHPQVQVVNAAVADANGMRDFYTDARGPSRQASFITSNLLKHGVPADQIVTVKVRSATIATLLHEHGFDRCDLLQIDAEGYDHQIVRAIDFKTVQPLIIRFEHVHMSNDDCNQCIELLASHGYRFITERRDIMALREP